MTPQNDILRSELGTAERVSIYYDAPINMIVSIRGIALASLHQMNFQQAHRTCAVNFDNLKFISQAYQASSSSATHFKPRIGLMQKIAKVFLRPLSSSKNNQHRHIHLTKRPLFQARFLAQFREHSFINEKRCSRMTFFKSRNKTS